MINENHKKVRSIILAFLSTITVAISIFGLVNYPAYVITASVFIFAFVGFYNAFMGNI